MARAETMVPGPSHPGQIPPAACMTRNGGCGSSHPHESIYSPLQQSSEMPSLGAQVQAFPQPHLSHPAHQAQQVQPVQQGYGTLMSTGPGAFGYQDVAVDMGMFNAFLGTGMSGPSNGPILARLPPMFVAANQPLPATDAGFVGPGGAVAMAAPAGNFATSTLVGHAASMPGQTGSTPQMFQVGPIATVMPMAVPQDACIAAAIHSQLTSPGEASARYPHPALHTSGPSGSHSHSHSHIRAGSQGTDFNATGTNAGSGSSSSSSGSHIARQLLGHGSQLQQHRRVAPGKLALRASSTRRVVRPGLGLHSEQSPWLQDSHPLREVAPGRGQHHRHRTGLGNPRLSRSSSHSALERAQGARANLALQRPGGLTASNGGFATAMAPQPAPTISSAPATLARGPQEHWKDEQADCQDDDSQMAPIPRCVPSPARLNVGSHRSLEASDLPPILVWRCKHPHGFFSMFSLALGHALACEQKGWTLVVDWTDKDLLYKGPPGEPNVWSAFFRQPAEMVYPHNLLVEALQQGRYLETDKHEVVFGAYRGVVQGYGSIPPSQATQGRELVQSTVALQDHFAQRLQGLMDNLLPSSHRWLAVHIRRGDKAVEAKVNFDLDDEALLLRIVTQCAAWCCTGVFLCTDDGPLKTRLQHRLELSPDRGGPGLAFSHYPSALSADSSKGTHFDKSLDSYTKADDVMVETMLMARGCAGLLSTYSNVSAAAVYLSPPGFLYTTFWDHIGSCGLDQAILEAGVASMAPSTCSAEAINPLNAHHAAYWQSLACAR